MINNNDYQLYSGHCWLIYINNIHWYTLTPMRGFPHSSVGKESACNAGDRVQFLGWEDPLKKGMAIHSSILAWKIPWTEEPCRLQSTGLQESDTT